MATIVKGNLYVRLDGKLEEIKRQIRQRGGYGFDPEKLDRALQALIEGRFELVGGQFPSLIPAGWTVVEDIAPTPDLDVSRLVLRSFLRDGETVIRGEDIRVRARELKGNWGLSDAPRFLADGGKRIAVEFQPFYIPLSGTVLRDAFGRLCIPWLNFRGERWCLDFGLLGFDWGGYGRLACSE